MRSVFISVTAMMLVAAPIEPAAQSGQNTAAWDATFRTIPDAKKHRRVHAPAERAAASSRIALRQGQRRVDSGEVQGMGMGRADRDLSGALSDAEGARCSNWSRPHRSRPRSKSRRLSVDPTSNQDAEQLPTYNAYSIDGDVTGAARLRELRAAGGLRGARPARHLRQGRDRHRALRRIVARHQAEGGGRARRGRLPHLLGSADDGYSVDDVFPNGPMRNRDGVQRGSVMDMPSYPGDPLTPGVGATPDAKRLDIKSAPTLTDDSGAADLVRRCAAAARGARRTGRCRRPGAGRCRSPIASVPVRRACT